MSDGKLELIIGPMFSGKTTELINRFNRYQEITDEIFLVNHSSDKRYGKNLVVVHNEHLKCNTTHFVDSTRRGGGVRGQRPDKSQPRGLFSRSLDATHPQAACAAGP